MPPTPRFALYLHPETCQGSKLYSDIDFVGYSVPHFDGIRANLAQALHHHPQLPLAKADFADFAWVHERQYLQQLEQLAQGIIPDEYPWLSMECRGYEFFLDAYCYGLGGFYAAIDAMQQGNLDHAYVFALGGHHAFAARGHGYCLLNPLAVAVRYAQQHGFAKILIIDWDIHHGDGTQSIFEHDSSVYHISSHNLADLYMGTQRVLRLGTTSYAQSVGQCNIPFLPAVFGEEILQTLGWETEFYRAEQSLSALQNAFEQVPFAPDLIFIFAGYDSHRDDGGKDITNWDNASFQALTRMVLHQWKDIPIISAHGGGYKPDVTIAAALAHLEVLAGN